MFHQFHVQKTKPCNWGCFALRLASLGELEGREAEVLTVTRDTTESDLKQRRELSRLGRPGWCWEVVLGDMGWDVRRGCKKGM